MFPVFNATTEDDANYSGLLFNIVTHTGDINTQWAIKKLVLCFINTKHEFYETSHSVTFYFMIKLIF